MSTSNITLDDGSTVEQTLGSEEENYTPTYNNYTGHSQKPTPEQVYYDGNFYYWLWDISGNLDEADGTSWLAYRAGTRYNPNGFNDTPSGENRTGPQAVTTAPGNLVGDDILDIKQISSSYNLLDGWNPGEQFEDRIAMYEDVAPFFFESVVDEQGNVEYPGMSLLFDSVVSGVPIDETDPRLIALKAPYTNEKIQYLNALGKSGYTISGKPNQKLLALKVTRAGQLDSALASLGLNPNKYKVDNSDTYEGLLNIAVQGDISAGLLKNFIGYVENLDGYAIGSEDTLAPLFNNVADKLNVDSSGLDLSDYIFNNKAQAKGTEILGAGVYNGLAESEKRTIATLYATEGEESVKEYLQTIFDNNPYFERYAGKGLNYGKIVGPYLKLYASIYGDNPDETSTEFLEELNNGFQDAGKNFRQKAYNSNNEFFAYNLASEMNKSLGGPVVRSIK